MKNTTATRKNNAIVSLLVFIIAIAAPSLFAQENTLSDAEIDTAILTALALDQAVNSNWVDVTTVDGIVTLSGRADNLLARERAAGIAETVKGVRSVVNQLDVVDAAVSDSELRRDVEDAFMWDPATEAYEIGVRVKDGTVTLTGTVNSWQERRLAATVAKSVRGVEKVRNQLEIDYELERSDYEIETEIEQRLKWDVLVDDALINVKVSDQVVTLTGTVGSAAEKSRATVDAWVTGVDQVRNDGLEIESWARDERFRKNKYIAKSDEAVRSAIKDAFVYDPRVNMFDIDVSVNNGRVTLKGSVNNLRAKRSAEQDARNTVGVFSVHNLISVRPDDVPSDQKIQSNVAQALEQDTYVDREEITVTVVDQVAYLTGTVDSYFEKAQADEVASGILGVTDVKNHLNVQNEYAPLTYSPYLGTGAYPYGYSWYHYPRDLTPKNTDWEIAESIRSELWWSPFVDSDDVTVTVDDGVATLIGTVDTWSEKNAARENAYEGGATAVKNKLRVEYGPES